MAIKLRSALKALWITGYKPTQTDFSDLFDSVVMPEDYRGKWFSVIIGDAIRSIIFDTPLPIGTTFDVIPICLSDGTPINFTISNITRFGFDAIAADTATLFYQINIQ
jgi:hypothetical protein